MADTAPGGEGAISSMTGYADLTVDVGAARYRLSARSVNQRGLDVDVKLPARFTGISQRIGALVRETLARGRVSVLMEEASAGDDTLFDEPFLERVRDLHRSLEKRGVSLRPPTLGELLSLKERLGEPPPDGEREARVVEAARALVRALAASRRAEGARLRTALDGQFRQARTACAAIASDADRIRELMVERAFRRFGLEPGEEADPKIGAEITLACAKADVTEELDRLRSHLDEIGRALETGGSVGRKVDFMLQECRREATTLTAKLPEAGLSRTAMDLCLSIEQMREQVQNIE